MLNEIQYALRNIPYTCLAYFEQSYISYSMSSQQVLCTHEYRSTVTYTITIKHTVLTLYSHS